MLTYSIFGIQNFDDAEKDVCYWWIVCDYVDLLFMQQTATWIAG